MISRLLGKIPLLNAIGPGVEPGHMRRAGSTARAFAWTGVSMALLALPPEAGAQAADLTATADRVFDAWNNTHGPGCAVGIAKGGTTLLEARLRHGRPDGDRPITPATILESGSVAKQFTATAILLLMQDGKLALDDDARKYLPELPAYGRTITVRHLLTHTSGLREWSNLVDWQGWPRGTRMHTQDVVFDLITRQKSLNYPVGDYYSYTNSGFLLLRTIVERVSGQSFAQFTAERIFKPLGMTHTQWRDDFTTLVPGLAQAYGRAGRRLAPRHAVRQHHRRRRAAHHGRRLADLERGADQEVAGRRGR